MQQQSPLRPAEFVRIRDGFIAFLGEPAGSPIARVISEDVLDAMAAVARHGRNRRHLLVAALVGAISIALAGVILGVVVEPIFIGAALLLVGGLGLIRALTRLKVRDELEIDELVTEPNETIRRNLRALDQFRSLLASGELPCQERLPDGTLRPVPANARRAFLADHGALLVLSRDQGLWKCIPHRPIPMSPLWIRLGGYLAAESVTSRTLIYTPDQELFDQRIDWLLSRADPSNARARSFCESIRIIVALRRLDLNGLTFERKKEVLRAEGIGESRVEKLHAGVYEPFNSFLRSLPMHECP